MIQQRNDDTDNVRVQNTIGSKKPKILKIFSSSISVQISLIFSIFILSLVLISILLTGFFAKQFFLHKSQAQLLSVYNTANQLLSNSELIDGKLSVDSNGHEIYKDLLKKCSTCSTSLCVISKDSSRVIISPETNSGHNIQRQLYNYLMGKFPKNSTIIKRTNDYIIELTYDETINVDYLELVGNTNDGSFILVREAVEGINQNASLAGQFILFVLILILPIYLIIAFIIGKMVGQPIKVLSDLSIKMANLDFDAHYEGDENNEIGQLGNSMNVLSDSLKYTIHELQMANKDLRKDILQKEEEEKRRSEFIADVSHELKTPLALIQGYAEGLVECINDDQEDREYYANVIIDEADKMNTIVKQLINLGKFESSANNIIREDFDIITLINQLLSSQKKVILESNIEVSLDFPEGCRYVFGDEFRIEEVLTNYLTNAIDHACLSNKPNPKIDLTLKEKNNKIIFTIFNTGEHIPDESIEKIWDKFYKVDKSRNRKFGGSGIGLSIVKTIIAQLGEECGARNVDNGVEFYFTISKSINADNANQ